MTDEPTFLWLLYNVILPVVEGAVRDVIEKLPKSEPDRHGGYFCLRLGEHGNMGPPDAVILIGDVVSSVTREQCFAFAQEKARRLADNPAPAHVSSWLTRDESENKWGGGIRTRDNYIAFSGLPELADEAAMLLAAVRLGWLTKEEADETARFSGNKLFLETEWRVAKRA